MFKKKKTYFELSILYLLISKNISENDFKIIKFISIVVKKILQNI